MNNEQRLMNVLLSPHISEKSTRLAEASNQIAFRVRTDARKDEIRRAVEKMFKVEVASVRVLNVKGKTKGLPGRNRGRRSDWRKAYIKLKPGFDIDFAEPVAAAE
ncbi:50S ribosomal protein L23 [Thioalkalivibrio sp. HK1]|uniref:50S ribosomal protein L23 n=1 Tax=Thioalkalivibrio sp. HK1 TaxID=1469245 RepID=UPI00046F74C0|nr:50S ribosomal protein L23 [Thioalkalivibrio sp. HK1]